MNRRPIEATCLLGLLLAAGCGGNPVVPPPPPPPPPAGPPSVVCASRAVTSLAVGQHVIIDPSTTDGCLRFPAAGGSGAEHLIVLNSTSGQRSSTGIQGAYNLRASSPITAVAGSLAAGLSAPGEPPLGRGNAAAGFDRTLRERERELSMGRAAPAAPPAGAALAAPPVLGEIRSFKACANLGCTSFATVEATAGYVGEHVAVFLDNTVPQSDPMQPADLAELGQAFDTYHYPIDTTAFGRESDRDQNGVVIVLMTDAVNALTPDCSNGRVVGYFFGGDLLTGPNSNNGEIFYTLVPAPATTGCPTAVTRRAALFNLKPTLIHEFQHMISFNQHVLIRSGNSEESWLNEGFSHFAEELGGRLIPDVLCPPLSGTNPPSCRSQYTSGDLQNAYDFAHNTEAFFMVYPTSSTGTLEERGAVWSFLRWTLDQFAAEPILATSMTRAMLATTLTGANNLQAQTGSTLATMIPEWFMALYLDDGPDLPSEPTGRLSYKSWGYRAVWTNPLNQKPDGPFSGFPLLPSTIAGTFTVTGTLRGGSGRHFLVVQQPNGVAIDVLAVKNTANELIDPALQARIGVVRIR